MNRRPIAAAVAATLAIASQQAYAAKHSSVSVSYDGTYNTNYRNGDKPIASCTSITADGFTEGAVGDGGGEGCKVGTGEYDLSVFGSNNVSDAYIAYKDGGDNDIEFKCLITDTFEGSDEAFAFAGCGIRASIAQAAQLFQCGSLQGGATALQCRYGANGVYTTVNGPVGQSRPRCVIMTFDDSTDTVKGFGSPDCTTAIGEIFTTTFDLTDPQTYLIAASKSAVETTQITFDDVSLSSTITAYTPTDPPDPTAPELITPIANQSGTQGQFFSLSCANNFLGADEYSISGLPGSTGLTFNTVTCLLAGTLTANDVGTRNLTVTASNDNGDTPDIFQFVGFASGTGNSINVPTSTNLVNCQTFESGGAVDPGDTLVMLGPRSSNIEFRNCRGADGNRITIRNASTAQTVLTTPGGADAILLRDSIYVDLTGIAGWTGNTSGCGTLNPLSGTPLDDCGIKVVGSAQHLVKFRGEARFITITGLHLDGNWNHTNENGAADVGFSSNDQNHCVPTGSEWREGIVFTGNYVQDVAKEGNYFGPNFNDNCPTGQDWPRLRNIEVSYNFFSWNGYDCTEIKSAYQGTNLVHHNRAENCGGGIEASGANSIGISIFEGHATIFKNVVKGTSAPPGGAPCYAVASNNGPASWGVQTSDLWGNLALDCDGPAFAFNKGANSDLDIRVSVRSNTAARVGKACVTVSAQITGPGTIRDMLCAETGGISGGANIQKINNRTGSIASMGFVNAAADDFRLAPGSPAIDSANACPSDDILDVTRPQPPGSQDNCDQGAFERE